MPNKAAIFVITITVTLCLGEIPSYIHVCHQKDPKLTQCIINSIEALRPKLKEGIAEINVPPLEPLPLDEIKLRSGPNQARISSNITNLKVWGPILFQITDLKADVPNKKFQATVNLPKLNFEGDYDMDVNVLILKYNGKGVMTGNFTDYIFDLTLIYEIKQKDGKNYMNIPKLGIKLTMGKSVLKMTGTDNKNPTLSQGLQAVLNDNTEVFMKEVLPALEDGLSVRFTDIANKIAHIVPYEELLPE
ncbi:unnamed protein product [Ceutorhynchus assimilis]|uniref:Uncharacterized protein n=1 Tax=Ceutorhynchus assimilis TaxID=467358 RepID=A0A9N9MQ32_9CUCU|nr:unnamed protein product [Ceutorhynchus assimilis]